MPVAIVASLFLACLSEVSHCLETGPPLDHLPAVNHLLRTHLHCDPNQCPSHRFAPINKLLLWLLLRRFCPNIALLSGDGVRHADRIVFVVQIPGSEQGPSIIPFLPLPQSTGSDLFLLCNILHSNWRCTMIECSVRTLTSC